MCFWLWPSTKESPFPGGSGCSSVWVHTMNYTERDCCNRRSYFPHAVWGETEPDKAKENTGCLQHTSPILSGSKRQGGPVELVQGHMSMKGKIWGAVNFCSLIFYTGNLLHWPSHPSPWQLLLGTRACCGIFRCTVWDPIWSHSGQRSVEEVLGHPWNLLEIPFFL